MKIYHKSSFYGALVILGLALLSARDIPQGDSADLFRTAVYALLGLYYLYCATNKEKARKLTIRDSDEMLVLERLKSYRAAFWTTIVLLLLAGYAALHFFDTPTGRVVSLTANLAAFAMILIYAFFLGVQSLQNS